MNQSSRELLIKLLNAWQNSPERERATRLPITQQRAPQYFAAVLPELKQALHAGLQEAETAGTVKLEWGKGYDSHILKRITLVDGQTLARYLKLPLAAQQADQAREVLEGEVSGREGWIAEFVAHMLDRWRCNKPADGITEDHAAMMSQTMRRVEGATAGNSLQRFEKFHRFDF